MAARWSRDCRSHISEQTGDLYNGRQKVPRCRAPASGHWPGPIPIPHGKLHWVCQDHGFHLPKSATLSWQRQLPCWSDGWEVRLSAARSCPCPGCGCHARGLFGRRRLAAQRRHPQNRTCQPGQMSGRLVAVPRWTPTDVIVSKVPGVGCNDSIHLDQATREQPKLNSVPYLRACPRSKIYPDSTPPRFPSCLSPPPTCDLDNDNTDGHQSQWVGTLSRPCPWLPWLRCLSHCLTHSPMSSRH